jgi:GT2 family glycosyltransferase
VISIVIPSWNNLPHLKLCVESLRRHSNAEYEIIVHLNDGSDGSLEWVKAQGLRYTHSDKNIGVCLSVNHLVAQASHDWVLYMNDDMVAAPGWDQAFLSAIDSVDTDLALFFGTLIQPETGGHPDIIHQDFGRTPENFDETAFLAHFKDDGRQDKEGAPSQPTLFHKKWWQMLGGYSMEFSPGMSSDDDLLMKFWVAGCRTFRMVGASRFYHFGMASTGRINHNQGGRMFVMKWGITQLEFYRHYMPALRRLDGGITPDNPHFCVRPTWLGKLRRVRYALRYGYPLDGIEAWDPLPGQTRFSDGD